MSHRAWNWNPVSCVHMHGNQVIPISTRPTISSVRALQPTPAAHTATVWLQAQYLISLTTAHHANSHSNIDTDTQTKPRQQWNWCVHRRANLWKSSRHREHHFIHDFIPLPAVTEPGPEIPIGHDIGQLCPLGREATVHTFNHSMHGARRCDWCSDYSAILIRPTVWALGILTRCSGGSHAELLFFSMNAQ